MRAFKQKDDKAVAELLLNWARHAHLDGKISNKHAAVADASHIVRFPDDLYSVYTYSMILTHYDHQWSVSYNTRFLDIDILMQLTCL